MRVLVACEFSGIVRDAFAAKGHDAWSCDLLPTESSGNHIVGDVLQVLDDGWDLMIAHPPCTYLTIAANRWHDKARQRLREDATVFFMRLFGCRIPKVAVENPIGVMSTTFRKPNQIVHPWWFGHPERKPICLWTKRLPPLKKTRLVPPESPKGVSPRGKAYYSLNWLPQTEDRWKIRSRTFMGLARAMAQQWG